MAMVEKDNLYIRRPHIYRKEVFPLPVGYKIKVLDALKEKGYSTYKLRKEKILAESTIQALRSGELVSYEIIARLCEMLGCDVGDLLKYEPEK